jgi:hypothetical protein
VYIAVKFGRQDIVQFLVEECHVALNSDQMVCGLGMGLGRDLCDHRNTLSGLPPSTELLEPGASYSGRGGGPLWHRQLFVRTRC